MTPVTGLHLAIGILAALYHRTHNGNIGQMVEVAMVDSVMNLCRVKYRDHGRLMNGKGALSEYSRPTLGLTYVPRAGNDSGGGQLGNCIPCKPFGTNDLCLHGSARSNLATTRDHDRWRSTGC